MAAYVPPEFTRDTVGTGPDAEQIHAGQVGPDFFQLLGTAPLLGRTLEDRDYIATPRAAVISHNLWRQRFGDDPAVVGRTMQVSDMTVEIVGVMPPEFDLPTPEVQLWRPLYFGKDWQNAGSRGVDALVVLGRMAPSATTASARAEMDAIAAQLRAEYPASNAALGVKITNPLVDRVIGLHHDPLAVAALRFGRVRAVDCLREHSRSSRSRAEQRAATSWHCEPRSAPRGSRIVSCRSWRRTSCCRCLPLWSAC